MNVVRKISGWRMEGVALLLFVAVFQVAYAYDSYNVVVRTDLPVAKHHETLVAKR